MIETEVAVVGGGPAGAAAATTLARAGRDVLVLDKARFPRDKICGDGLTTSALRRLESLGLDPSTVASWHVTEDVVLRAPGGLERHFALPRGHGEFAVAARRRDLDAAVLDLARCAGAKVVDGAAVIATVAGRHHVTLEAESLGEVRADWVIAADGMWSAVRKQLGVGPIGYRGDAHAFRQYFQGVGPRAARELFVSFEEDLLPGYIWSFPLSDGRANVGFGVHRGGRITVQQMGALWPRLLDRPHVRDLLGPDAHPEGPHRAWPIPARIDGMPLSAGGGRVLFVGDAVAASDRMSGEGIGQALQTGSAAAASIRDLAAAGPAEVARAYGNFVRHELVPDHRMSTLLVRLLSSEGGARLAVALAGANGWTQRNFVRWLFEDEARAGLFTPRRWHRSFLGRPGAYASASRPGSNAT